MSFNVLCGVSGCREVFRTFSAFNSHIYRHHRSEIGISNDQTPAMLQSGESLSVQCAPCVSNVENVSAHDLQHEETSYESEDNLPRPHDATMVDAGATSHRETSAAVEILLQLREGVSSCFSRSSFWLPITVQ